MPIYEYVCGDCGQIIEALQRMSDPPLEECPSGDGGSLFGLRTQRGPRLRRLRSGGDRLLLTAP